VIGDRRLQQDRRMETLSGSLDPGHEADGLIDPAGNHAGR
jgi:hypothetical protein